MIIVHLNKEVKELLAESSSFYFWEKEDQIVKDAL